MGFGDWLMIAFWFFYFATKIDRLKQRIEELEDKE